MNFINIILLILWFILVTLFLREIANPKQWSEETTFSRIKYTLNRSYIVQKYIPYFSILVFVTVVKVFFI
nr:hypothetical protein [Methanobrevibacter arboriphilus]